MDVDKDRKRKKHSDENSRKEKKSRRAPQSKPRSPEKDQDRGTNRKRRRSRSQSPAVKRERDDKTREEPKEPETKENVPPRKAKDIDMLNTRTGGAYIPPARLRMMQAQITDKSSMAYQRLAWEALKKSIHGHINKINVGNIGIIIKELLKENIVRGRGLLCRSVIQAQAASPTFTNVYAALVAAVNSRFPNIGELLLKRLVIQFKRGFKRNDKPTCISSASFIAHLVNQRVAHEIIALELLTLLVETPTDDSVEVAIAFMKECGQKLSEVSSKGVNTVFEMLRNILHEGHLDKRVQYMIEVMFQVWKDGFKDHPALIEELELVPEEEQFTHLLMLDDATDPQDILNVFKHDEKYEENEEKYKTLSKEILGSDAESGDDGSGESGSDESDEEEASENKEVTIIDNTETNLVALRRTIYLTINSSLDFEECAHKLMKMQLKPGQEVELCHMFLDCCAEQRTYEKFYGLLAQRFCNMNRMYIAPFEEIFKESYSTAHRLDTNRLRNVSKFFAHLLFTDSISWEVLECVKLNEEDTTSSSRIYIKILFQELAEYMGLKKLNDRLKDPTLQEAFGGVFPRDNPKHTRFSINFFTSIGLGGLTDALRDHLKQMPKNVPPPITEIHVSSSESSSSSDSSSDSDSSSSDSEKDDGEKSKKSKKDKSKDKAQKSPEKDKEKPVERWGHDGFYDQHGPGARRETRPEKTDDGFVRPWDVPQRRDRRRVDARQEQEDPRRRDNERRRNDSRNDSGYEDSRRQEGRNDGRRRDDHRSDRDSGYEDRRNLEGDRRKEDRRRDSGYEDARKQEVDRKNGEEDKESRKNEDRRDRDRDDVRERNRDDVRERNRDDVRERNRDDVRERNRDDVRERNRDDVTERNRDDVRERNRDNTDRRRRDVTSGDKDKESRKNEDRRDKDRDDVIEKNKDHDFRRRRDDQNNDDDHINKDRHKDRRSKKDRSSKESKRDEDRRNRDDEARYRKEIDSDSESEQERDSREEKRSKKNKKKHEKENIERKYKQDRRKESSSDSSSDSSDSSDSEDESSSKREDGWDIRREGSVRREAPTGYWNTYKVDSREEKRYKDRRER